MELLLLLGLGAAGYYGWQKYHTKTVTTPSWLPPIPALTQTYTDYTTIVPTAAELGSGLVAWNITDNAVITIVPGMSLTGSPTENKTLGTVPGTLFWVNVGGVAKRCYTPVAIG